MRDMTSRLHHLVYGIAALVIVAAWALSYDALIDFGLKAGINPRLGWLYPVPIDGQLGVGILAAIALRQAPRRVRAYVWLQVFIGTVTSLTGNAFHASHTPLSLPLAMAGSSVPSVALALTIHLITLLLRHHRKPTVVTAVEAPAAVVVRRRPHVMSRRRGRSWANVIELAERVGHDRITKDDIMSAVAVGDRQAARLLAQVKKGVAAVG